MFERNTHLEAAVAVPVPAVPVTAVPFPAAVSTSTFPDSNADKKETESSWAAFNIPNSVSRA